MPDDRLSKNQRRDQARELARIEREKAKRRERLLRWAVPSGVTVVILAIIAVVVLVVVSSAPAPQTKAGPKNMITDGIVFTGVGGKMVPTKTPAIPPKGTPSPVATEYTPGVASIVTYVDFSCPACQSFEATNGDQIKQLVASGAATLAVHPVAILDSHYTTPYSTRSNNAAACV
ncbi:MAG TPA: DsbA family protein, partial [Pseudolysinimonas sp.]|nr:DsbA family protein [Pseudolysinimonas sp.]